MEEKGGFTFLFSCPSEEPGSLRYGLLLFTSLLLELPSQLLQQGKGLLEVRVARLEKEIQGGLGFQLGTPAVLNLVARSRHEAARC